MDHYNFLMGAKVGDLFHSLVSPAYMHLLHGKKSNFYITEAFDKFETSLERTIEELEPIMAFQPYINSFEKFRNGVGMSLKQNFRLININDLLLTPITFKNLSSGLLPNC